MGGDFMAEISRHRTQLRQILVDRFDEGELRTLCFELDVKYEDLPVWGRANKVTALIEYLERRERLADLVKVGRRMRSDVSWPLVSFEMERGLEASEPSRSKQSAENILLLHQQLQSMDETEIDTFCLLHISSVHAKFGRGMRRDEKINLLLYHCRRKSGETRRLVALLAATP